MTFDKQQVEEAKPTKRPFTAAQSHLYRWATPNLCAEWWHCFRLRRGRPSLARRGPTVDLLRVRHGLERGSGRGLPGRAAPLRGGVV